MRDELLGAYHSKAVFSISLNVNSQATKQSHKFGEYYKESRNLKYIFDAGSFYLTIKLNQKKLKINFLKN